MFRGLGGKLDILEGHRKNKFGQTWSWPNLVWPNLVLAKLGLAKLGLGQTWFGQTWIWPSLVWPNLVIVALLPFLPLWDLLGVSNFVLPQVRRRSSVETSDEWEDLISVLHPQKSSQHCVPGNQIVRPEGATSFGQFPFCPNFFTLLARPLLANPLLANFCGQSKNNKNSRKLKKKQ